jgi:hypothetical protein
MKANGTDSHKVKETRPKMHGSRAERSLMSGTGALIKQSGNKVKVSGEKPGKQKKR